MDGITATRLIKANFPEIVIIGISAETKDYQTYAMRKAGAVDVLKKENAIHELYAAIQQAVAAVKPVFIVDETTGPTQSPDNASSSTGSQPARPSVDDS
jgi:DNA-binding response OmpR family regulator